jgi:hypothetical protein
MPGSEEEAAGVVSSGGSVSLEETRVGSWGGGSGVELGLRSMPRSFSS